MIKCLCASVCVSTHNSALTQTLSVCVFIYDSLVAGVCAVSWVQLNQHPVMWALWTHRNHQISFGVLTHIQTCWYVCMCVFLLLCLHFRKIFDCVKICATKRN